MKCTCREFQENHPNCTHCSRRKQILVEENKRKYILKNPSGKQVCRVRVDGCVIKSQNQRKCDYLVIICKSEDEVNNNHVSSGEDLYFIELKGKHLLDAVEQLTQTIEYFKAQFTGKVFARVVLSKSPDVKSTQNSAKVSKLRKLLKKYRGDFAYSSRQYEEQI